MKPNFYADIAHQFKETFFKKKVKTQAIGAKPNKISWHDFS